VPEDNSKGEETKFPPLDNQQILMAQFKVDALHKMAKTPYYKSFPWLCCCLKLCAKDEDEKIEEKEEKRKKLYEDNEKAKSGTKKERRAARKLLKLYEAKLSADEEMAEDLEAVGGDAFMLLGSGLMAYRKMLGSLAVCFIIMSLLMTPVIISYKEGDGLANTSPKATSYDKMTIANMGYSSIHCS
jgi:hypothetical protein